MAELDEDDTGSFGPADPDTVSQLELAALTEEELARPGMFAKVRPYQLRYRAWTTKMKRFCPAVCPACGPPFASYSIVIRAQYGGLKDAIIYADIPKFIVPPSLVTCAATALYVVAKLSSRGSSHKTHSPSFLVVHM